VGDNGDEFAFHKAAAIGSRKRCRKWCVNEALCWKFEQVPLLKVAVVAATVFLVRLMCEGSTICVVVALPWWLLTFLQWCGNYIVLCRCCRRCTVLCHCYRRCRVLCRCTSTTILCCCTSTKWPPPHVDCRRCSSSAATVPSSLQFCSHCRCLYQKLQKIRGFKVNGGAPKRNQKTN